jgi:hypothetical protein
VFRRYLKHTLSALILVMTAPVASLADSSGITTSVILSGDANGTGCAVWVASSIPISFGELSSLDIAHDRFVSQALNLRIVNGQDVTPSSCTVTVGGSSFMASATERRSIHMLKLSQSPASTVPVLLVPQVNEMALGELQSTLVQAPQPGGCVVVTATLDIPRLPVLASNELATGTVTLTLSGVAP